MGANTKIEWTDHTWNGWRGCEHATLPDGSAHPGCTNCYAETMSKRNPNTLGIWGEHGKRVRGTDDYWKLPLKWNKAAEQSGERARVFALSLGDVFEAWTGPIHATDGTVTMRCNRCHEKTLSQDNVTCLCGAKLRPQTMDDMRRDMFSLIDRTPALDWLLLTKRPDNVRSMWPIYFERKAEFGDVVVNTEYARPNVWLLTSVSNQDTTDLLTPKLLKCRDLVPVLGLSVEPLLGPIDLRGECDCFIQAQEGAGNHDPLCAATKVRKVDWVIVGGESGHGARPMDPSWVRNIRDQCLQAGVPFFFKQHGAWCPESDVLSAGKNGLVSTRENLPANIVVHRPGEGWPSMARVGKKAAGRMLDGRTWDEMPA